MANRLFKTPLRALDASGNGASGAKVYLYETGTTTPVTAFTDSGATTAHPTPLVADGGGTFSEIYVTSSAGIKVDLTDSLGASFDGSPFDPVFPESASSTGAENVSFSPTVLVPEVEVQAAIETVSESVKAIGDTADVSATIYTTGGTTTSYTLAVSGVTTYAANDRYWARCNATNTGASTINVQSVGAKDIKKYDSSGAIGALIAGDFAIGSEYLLHYDDTQFVIISERHARAADSIWEAGTSVVQHVPSPANVRASALATTIGTELWMPWANVPIVSGATGTVAYTGFAIVSPYDCFLTCLTPEHNYLAGDIVYVGLNGGNPSNKGVTFHMRGSTPYYILGSNATTFSDLNRTTGAAVNFTNANWDMTIQVLTKSNT